MRTRDALIQRTGDTEFVLKVARHDREGHIVKVAREGAILSAMDFPKGIPRSLRPLDHDFTSHLENPSEGDVRFARHCQLGTMISEYVGDIRLDSFLTSPLSSRTLLQIGAKLIEIIAHIHSRGVMHLDLHGGNILMDRDEDIVGSLRVIDFGESELFVNPSTGTHMPLRPIPWTGLRNVLTSTPWMLRNESSSRRDDFFRVPFLLLVLAGGGANKFLGIQGFLYEPPQVADRMCLLRHERYPVLNELMAYACGLEYTEEPDYVSWTHRLREAAETFSPDELIASLRHLSVQGKLAAKELATMKLNPFARPVKSGGPNPFARPPVDQKVRAAEEGEIGLVENVSSPLIRRSSTDSVGAEEKRVRGESISPGEMEDEIEAELHEIDQHRPLMTEQLPDYVPRSLSASPRFMSDVNAVRGSQVLRRFLDLRNRLEELELTMSEDCSVNSVLLGRRLGLMDPPRKTSVGTVVVESGNLFVKIAKNIPFFVEAILMEKAVMQSISSEDRQRYFVPVLRSAGQSELCGLRTLVTVNGGKSLGGTYKMGRKEIAKIAVETIEILKFLHSLGVVHGDIHKGNMIVSGVDGKIRLIDLGRARVFVTPESGHIKPTYTYYPSGLNMQLAAPFELEQFPASRRDDMFRLAETLYRLFASHIGRDDVALTQYQHHRYSGPTNLALIKRYAVVDGYDELVQFHHEMAQLEFYDRPDYEKWTHVFTRIMNA
jgi:serine/threonine protein kinase